MLGGKYKRPRGLLKAKERAAWPLGHNGDNSVKMVSKIVPSTYDHLHICICILLVSNTDYRGRYLSRVFVWLDGNQALKLTKPL